MARGRPCASWTTLTSTSTTTCTRRAGSCFAGSANPARRARRTNGRSSSSTTTPSGASSSDDWARYGHEGGEPRAAVLPGAGGAGGARLLGLGSHLGARDRGARRLDRALGDLRVAQGEGHALDDAK